MNARHDITTEDAAIRALLEDWARAVRAKDVDGILAHYAPEILSYDCHTHMELKGVAAHRAHLEACFPHMEGPMVFEIHELEIEARGDMAFGRYLARCGATGADGEEHAGWNFLREIPSSMSAGVRAVRPPDATPVSQG
ncbi:MAG: DUF4440 domain-containing protein [Alphaproteobacteria bacterium]|nr:DUF4440 domain-containing protein [Alphaproteobacteria bacterium]